MKLYHAGASAISVKIKMANVNPVTAYLVLS